MKLKSETSVLVVGGGPVGLFAGLSLAERGVDVEIIEKETRGALHSYALALHPLTLRLLDEHGVLRDLIEQGHRVERIAIYAGSKRVGTLDVAALGGRFPFLLVLPQSVLEGALQERLRRSNVRVRWNHQAQELHSENGAVVAKVARMEEYSMGYPIARSEWLVTKELSVRARYVIGADGYDSFVRKQAQILFDLHGEAQAFAVFEYPCAVENPREATLVFHEGTTNVAWPLDERRVRFSFQVPADRMPAPSVETLVSLLAERAPWFPADVDEVHWTSAAIFERRLVSPFGRGPMWLAGDAAHVTGPVGAQSMNVGLREAKDLATRIAAALKVNNDAPLDGYDAERRAEWRRLLELDAALSIAPATAAWLQPGRDRIVPCVPATGIQLDALLAQIGIRLS